MASPAIIWRNSKVVQQRRLWNQARQSANSRIYIVVRSGFGEESGEGLPNLEMIEGGTKESARQARQVRSRG
jgi:hypothetical protein